MAATDCARTSLNLHPHPDPRLVIPSDVALIAKRVEYSELTVQHYSNLRDQNTVAFLMQCIRNKVGYNSVPLIAAATGNNNSS